DARRDHHPRSALRGERRRAEPPPAAAGRVHRAGQGQGQPAHRDPRGARPQGAARPHAVLRAARPGQDHARGADRARAEREHPHDERARGREARRPRVEAHEHAQRRHPVHRRDPPAAPGGGGVPLPGDGGLPDRHPVERGAQGDDDHDADRAVHAHRRHHALRDAHVADARAVRHQPAAQLLRHRHARAHRAADGGGAARGDRGGGGGGDRVAVARHAAHREPAPAPRARLRRGEGRRAHHARGGRRRVAAARRGRVRARRHGRARAARDHREVRRRPGGDQHDRGSRGRRLGHDRGGVRALPRAERIPAAHPARAHGDESGVPPLRLRGAGARDARAEPADGAVQAGAL
ncbi:MAG: RuvB, partial [uncultured Gemmatimonadaceae bacterium]